MQNPMVYPDLSQKVYEALRARILNGELKPGEKLTQQTLAKYLSVSRMPLHRAFQMLESDLLVEQKPRRGFYVRDFEPAEILDAFEVRQLLEGLAVRKLAQHDDRKLIAKKLYEPFRLFLDIPEINENEYTKKDRLFHLMIMEMTDNVILQKLNKVVGHFLLHSFSAGLVRSPNETLPEHIEIIECIESGDPEGAEKAMTNHIHQSITTFKNTLPVVPRNHL